MLSVYYICLNIVIFTSAVKMQKKSFFGTNFLFFASKFEIFDGTKILGDIFDNLSWNLPQNLIEILLFCIYSNHAFSGLSFPGHPCLRLYCWKNRVDQFVDEWNKKDWLRMRKFQELLFVQHQIFGMSAMPISLLCP